MRREMAGSTASLLGAGHRLRVAGARARLRLRARLPAARLVVLVAAGLAGPLAAAAAAPSERAERSVLVIEADQPDLPIYLQANDAFRAFLRDETRHHVDVFVESLDLSRFNREGYLGEVEDWLATKYRGRHLDAVVALGPVAYRAVAQWRDRLWPGVPIVFGGVDRGTVEALGQVSNSVGTLIEFGHLDTIRVALELLPATRHLVIVGGVPDRDPHVRFFGAQIVEAFDDRLDVIDLSGLPMAEILDRSSRLPADSIVIVTSFSVDGASRFFTGQEVCALLAPRANAPVFGFFRTYLGSGVVGGVLLDPAIVGREAAALTAPVLEGKSASSIAVGRSDANAAAFDWRQLERWGISERRLPAGSVIEFEPRTAWQEYRLTFLLVAGVILLEAFLIGALLFERRSRREVNRELHRLSGQLLTAQEDERRRVARDLHDDISQRLSLLAIELDAAKLETDGGAGARADEAAAKVHALAVDVHAIAHNLHPPRLEAMGLAATLRAFCEDVAQRQSARISCRIAEPQAAVPADVALALFRVAQEAVQNAVKHSGSSRIDVELASDGGGLILTVDDDGRGLVAEHEASGGGLGIAGMRERVRYVGGRLEIDDRPGSGTTVRARVPMSQRQRAG